MRIAFLDSTGQAGGAERCLLDVLAGLRAARPDWALHVTFGADGPMVAEARALGVTATVLPFPAALARLGDAAMNGAGRGRGLNGRLALLRKIFRAGPQTASYVIALRRALRNAAPDLVHSNGLKMDLLGMWARPAATPLVWHVHDYVASRPLMRRLIRLASGNCAAAIANSRSVAQDVRAVCGEDLKVFTVYNGIDLDRFSPTGSRLDLDTLAGLAPAGRGTIRVGLVATMARWKGHEVFLRALAMIPAQLAVRGYLIGGPIYQTDGSQYSLEELRSLAVRMGISDRVGSTGFIEDCAAAMRSLDVVVHASTAPEPFGLAIAEAMACGKAVIMSEAGGAAEIVSAGTEALSHPPGDASALARCIERFAADACLRARFGASARRAAEQRFDRSRLVEQLITIYQAVVESRTDLLVGQGLC